MHVSFCATIVDHKKNLSHFLQVPGRFYIFAFVCPSSKRKVTNRPLDCLTSSWGLTSTCPIWRRITTEMLGDKKHVVVKKKPKGRVTVYTDVRKKSEWMFKREVLIIGDRTIISTWVYEPIKGPFLMGYFETLSLTGPWGWNPRLLVQQTSVPTVG